MMANIAVKVELRGVCAAPFFAGCRPLGAPRIASAARRQIRKGRAGGRMRNKNGICSDAVWRTQGEPGRGAGTRGAAWGGICENGVLGVENSRFSVPGQRKFHAPKLFMYFRMLGATQEPLGSVHMRREGLFGCE